MKNFYFSIKSIIIFILIIESIINVKGNTFNNNSLNTDSISDSNLVTPSVNLDSVYANQGDTVRVQLTVNNINDIRIFKYLIQFDTTVLKFIKVENNELNLSSLNYYRQHDTLIITGNTGDTIAMDLESNTELNIVFVYNTGQTILTFLQSSYIENNTFNLINAII